MASLPTGTVIFAIGALKLGSAVNKEIYTYLLNARIIQTICTRTDIPCNWTVRRHSNKRMRKSVFGISSY